MTTTLELNVHRWGVGGGRTCLLVHGLAGAGATWWRIANALAGAGFHVTAPDLRGHGGSPLADRYRFEDFAADLATLGHRWDLVVGHSLGGPIVAELLKCGVEAERTVLLDPVFDIPPEMFDLVAEDQLSEADPFADPAQLLAANPDWHPLDAHTKAHASRAVARFTVAQVMSDNRPWQASSLLDTATGPVHILAADPDIFTLCPETSGRRLTRNPAVTYRVVTGAGHSVHRDQPGVVIAACVD